MSPPVTVFDLTVPELQARAVIDSAYDRIRVGCPAVSIRHGTDGHYLAEALHFLGAALGVYADVPDDPVKVPQPLAGPDIVPAADLIGRAVANLEAVSRDIEGSAIVDEALAELRKLVQPFADPIFCDDCATEGRNHLAVIEIDGGITLCASCAAGAMRHLHGRIERLTAERDAFVARAVPKEIVEHLRRTLHVCDEIVS